MYRKWSLSAVPVLVAALMLLAVPLPADSPAPQPAVEKPAASDAAVKLASCSKCGDGRCTPQCGENSTTCPADCGVGSPSKASAAAPARQCANAKK